MECQQERSQQLNKEIALRTLRAKLYQQVIEEQLSQEQSARKLQVRTGGAPDLERALCCRFVSDVFGDRASESVCLTRGAYRGGESCTLKWQVSLYSPRFNAIVDFSGNEKRHQLWLERRVKTLAEIFQKGKFNIMY